MWEDMAIVGFYKGVGGWIAWLCHVMKKLTIPVDIYEWMNSFQSCHDGKMITCVYSPYDMFLSHQIENGAIGEFKTIYCVSYENFPLLRKFPTVLGYDQVPQKRLHEQRIDWATLVREARHTSCRRQRT